MSSYQVVAFRSRLNRSLEEVRKILDLERSKGLAVVNENCQHRFDDKFTLVEQLSACVGIGVLNVLAELGLSSAVMGTVKGWARTSEISLRVAVKNTCKYLREAVRKESSGTQLETEYRFGILSSMASTKVVTKITEYFYDFQSEYTISVFKGTGHGPGDSIELLSRTANQECVRRTKAFPYPESTEKSESVPITWLFHLLENSSDEGKDAANSTSGISLATFTINRSASSCATPTRNSEVRTLQSNLARLAEFASNVQTFLCNHLTDIHRTNADLAVRKLDFSLVKAHADDIFMPLQPLFRSPAENEDVGEEPAPAPAIETASTALISSATPVALYHPSESNQDVSLVQSQHKVTLFADDLNLFLAAHARSLSHSAATFVDHFPASTVTNNAIFSVVEAQLEVLCIHLRDLITVYQNCLLLCEDLLRRQLVAAIGRELNAGDFSAYMNFHNRKLFQPVFQPRPWSHAVRRTPRHSPEGALRIEMNTSQWQVFGSTASANTGSNSDGYQPLECFSTSRSVSIDQSEALMSFPINAATRIHFAGERHVHAWLGHSFSTGSTSTTAPELRLAVNARQFCGFIVVLGRITSTTTFDPKHAFIIKNKEELLIPLLLETIPNAKQFREAISSLSPEQQRFAKAYRSMQLESTLLGICVLQIKPQLEAVLQLPPDSLTKEIKLTQDLLQLFIEHQISPDLLSYEPAALTSDGQDRTTTEQRLQVVRGHVQRIQKLLDERKDAEVREQQMQRSYLGTSTTQDLLDMRNEQEDCDDEDRALDSISESVRILNESLSTISQRHEQLDLLVDHSEALESQAVHFKRASRTRRSMTSGLFGGGGSRGGSVAESARKDFANVKRKVSAAPEGKVGAKSAPRPPSAVVMKSEATLRAAPPSVPVPAPSPADDNSAREVDTFEAEKDHSRTADDVEPQAMEEAASASGTALDFTALPRLLDEAFDRLDADHVVRPAILNTGETWKKRQPLALALQSTASSSASSSKDLSLGTEEQLREKLAAFDLLDALTRSGALPMVDAALHVVVACTHVFDDALMETVLHRNRNPIEDVERSSLVLASTLFDQSVEQMVQAGHVSRLRELPANAPLLAVQSAARLT